MTGKPQDGVGSPSSLPAVHAGQRSGLPPTATPVSTLENDMQLMASQMARSHLESRQREAEQWRIRRIALAVRKAQAADRRARLARDGAVLAAREAVIALAR